MTASRMIFNHLPQSIEIPKELQGRAAEVIVLEMEQAEPQKSGFKEWLQGMPTEVDETLFERSAQTNESRLRAIRSA